MLNNERIVYLPVQIYLISNENIRNWMHISMLGKFLVENPIYKLCTNQNPTNVSSWDQSFSYKAQIQWLKDKMSMKLSDVRN